MRHPQYFIDHKRIVAKLIKRIDKIRSGEYKPGREWCVADALISFTRHDAVAGQLLSILAGETVKYTGAMNLYNGTGEDCEKLQALKEDLLGPLAIDGVADAAHLKSLDLARYFTRFAELGAPVPRSLLATLCAEVARLTGAAVSSEVVSRWRAAPLLLAADAGADASAGLAGTAASVLPGFAAAPAHVAAARAVAPAPLLAAAPAPVLAAAPAEAAASIPSGFAARAPVARAAPAPLLVAALAPAAACVIDQSAARQALEMLAKAVAGRADLEAKVSEIEVLLDAPAPATSASPAASAMTIVSLADTAAANASSGPMDVEAAPLTGAAAAPQSVAAAAPDAAAGASDLQIDALRAWLASVPEAVRADAKHAACNTHMMRFQASQRRRSFPVGYTAEAVFGTKDVDAINALPEDEFLRLRRIAVNALPEVAKRESELAERRAEQDAARAKRDAEVERIQALERRRTKEEQTFIDGFKKTQKDRAEREANGGKAQTFQLHVGCAVAFPKKNLPLNLFRHLTAHNPGTNQQGPTPLSRKSVYCPSKKPCTACEDWVQKLAEENVSVGLPGAGWAHKRDAVLSVAAEVRAAFPDITFGGVELPEARKRKGAKGAAPPAKKLKK